MNCLSDERARVARDIVERVYDNGQMVTDF